MKPPAIAKSRLHPLGDAVRSDLVAAFAADTVLAALGCTHVRAVLAVTDDHRLAATLSALGADVVPDGTTDDLNESLRLGAAELLRRHPGLAVVGLCADLPAVRSDELERVLAALPPAAAAFLSDEQQAGTTLYGAPALDAFVPCFGRDSRRRHLRSGAVELTVRDVPGARRDVDTPGDLADAVSLGVGRHTRQVLARHSL